MAKYSTYLSRSGEKRRDTIAFFCQILFLNLHKGLLAWQNHKRGICFNASSTADLQLSCATVFPRSVHMSRPNPDLSCVRSLRATALHRSTEAVTALVTLFAVNATFFCSSFAE